MRFEHLLIASLLLTACGGRSINANRTRDLIVGVSQEALGKQDVDVLTINQVSGAEAIVETKLKTAFRLEKVRGKWVVRDVRLGNGQWEKVSDLLQTVEMVRINETRKSLDQIAEAILKYRERNGGLPAFRDYISLSDLLSPMYLTPLIRLDAWGRPLAAERLDGDVILLRSAGPDGKYGTSDDIRRTVPP
jgi:hypothetical protein